MPRAGEGLEALIQRLGPQLAKGRLRVTTRFSAISVELMLSERGVDLVEEGFDGAVPAATHRFHHRDGARVPSGIFGPPR